MQEPGRFLQVIMGLRQVGKTTLVTQFAALLKMDYYFISADSVAASSVTWLEQQWETDRIKLAQQEPKEFLPVIDEIQKIDNWSVAVKLLWDTDTRNNLNLKVILLGSTRLMLQQDLTESLAGRLESTYMGTGLLMKCNRLLDGM